MPNISVYLSVEEFRDLCNRADKEGVKPTKLARQLIAEGLKAAEKRAEAKAGAG
jgi:hypothetical protein